MPRVSEGLRWQTQLSSRLKPLLPLQALIALEAAPPSCGLEATSAGPPLAWGAAGNALARRVPWRAGRAVPRHGHQQEQGGRGWGEAGGGEGGKGGFIFPILPV